MAREMSMAMPSAIVRADEGRGICQAVLTGLRSAPPQFIVALGDCLFDGEFGPMPEGPFTGVAVQHQPESEWGRSYAVGEHQNLIEKPSLGLGAYFFTWSHLWALEQYQGITAAMGALEARTAVHRIEFTGFYRNLTYPEDLQKPWPG